jgi:hypothetical protein
MCQVEIDGKHARSLARIRKRKLAVTLSPAMGGFNVVSMPDLVQHNRLSSTAVGYRSRAMRVVGGR